MKKYIFNIALCITVLLSACSDMNDLHNPYLEKGETVYAPKVDSVGVKSGNLRLGFDIFLRAQRITHGIIYWNNDKDFLEFDLDIAPGEIKELYLNDLEEKSHVFTFITFDKNNNPSLPFEVVGNVYGPDYANALLNRGIDFISEEEGKTTIHWKNAGNSHGVLLTYTDNKGDIKQIEIPSEEESTLIPGAVAGEDFSYITYYKPEKNAIDLFKTKEKIQNFPFPDLDRTGWTTQDASTEETVGEGEGNGVAASVLDGDFDTFWHSQWKDGTPTLPHSFIIDMKKIVEIGGIEIVRRKNSTDTRRLKFDVSEDGVTFTTVQEMDFGNSDNTTLSKTVTFENINARYVKIWVTESNSPPHASIAEVFIKGREIQ